MSNARFIHEAFKVMFLSMSMKFMPWNTKFLFFLHYQVKLQKEPGVGLPTLSLPLSFVEFTSIFYFPLITISISLWQRTTSPMYSEKISNQLVIQITAQVWLLMNTLCFLPNLINKLILRVKFSIKWIHHK